MQRTWEKTGLLLVAFGAVAVAGTGVAAGTVTLGSGIQVNISGDTANHTVMLNLSDDFQRFEVQPDYVFVGSMGLQLRATGPVTMTMQEADPAAVENETAVSFTADGLAGSETEFTITGLAPQEDYRIRRDGNTFDTVTTDSQGDLIFSSSTGNLYTFDIIRADTRVFYAGTDSIEMGLGDTLQSYVRLYNPLDEPASYTIRADASMADGTVVVGMEDDGRSTDRLTIEVDAKTSREIPVSYTAASCTAGACTGTVTYTVRSQETDDIYTDDTDIFIQRNRDVYGSPGITEIQILLLGVIATVFVAFFRRRDI